MSTALRASSFQSPRWYCGRGTLSQNGANASVAMIIRSQSTVIGEKLPRADLVAAKLVPQNSTAPMRHSGGTSRAKRDPDAPTTVPPRRSGLRTVHPVVVRLTVVGSAGAVGGALCL